MKPSDSPGSLIKSASLQVEIDALNTGYAVATQVVSALVQGKTDTPVGNITKAWTMVSEAVTSKIVSDMKKLEELDGEEVKQESQAKLKLPGI